MAETAKSSISPVLLLRAEASHRETVEVRARMQEAVAECRELLARVDAALAEAGRLS